MQASRLALLDKQVVCFMYGGLWALAIGDSAYSLNLETFRFNGQNNLCLAPTANSAGRFGLASFAHEVDYIFITLPIDRRMDDLLKLCEGGPDFAANGN